MGYYTIQNGIILTADTEETLTRFYNNVYELPIDYKEGKYIAEGSVLVLNTNWAAEQVAKERERIQALSMTRSDFFDGTIKAFGADSDDLLVAIQTVLATAPISEIEKKVAINNYRNALNFYRKHPLFTILSGVAIPLGGVTITITSSQWDRFFDETDKKNPDAYKELLPPLEESEEE